MSKKRGLSLEEKRTALLEIFHDTQDVFLLKDIEKLGPKKGVIQQSIKDVIQSLVDDDLVHQEKIGSSKYFWSFPSEAAVKMESKLKDLESMLLENQLNTKSLQDEISKQNPGKEDSSARAERMEQKQALEHKIARQQSELDQFADNDPERFNHLRESALIARDAANRWLDNIEMLKKWMKKRFDGQDQQLDVFFTENGYKEDMEYLQE